MRLLVEIAALCCIALVATSVALWWSMRRATRAALSEYGGIERRSNRPANAYRGVERRRSAEHPRLDLAAGLVASSQSVHSARQRSADRDGGPPSTVSAARAAAYATRQDRAFAGDVFGDLSDPDTNRPAMAETPRRRSAD